MCKDAEGATLPQPTTGKNPIQGVYDNVKSIKHMEIAVDEPLRCAQVEECLKIMDRLTLKDIGLTVQELDKIQKSQCVNIADTENFEISAFIIPKGCSIPLHDHPNMAVCTKVVHGQLRLQSFTPAPSLPQPNGDMDCTLVFDGTKSNTDAAWLLTPIDGNIHGFYAVTTCVIFDILLPPYDDRPCLYYQAVPRTNDPDCKDYELKVLEDVDFTQLPDMTDYHGYLPQEDSSRCVEYGSLAYDTSIY